MITYAPNLKKRCDALDSASHFRRGQYPVLSRAQQDASYQIYRARFNTVQKPPDVLVVTGETGVGKSTVLTNLTTRLALVGDIDIDAKNRPELLVVPVGRKTSHQILRTILDPYVPWSKTNGYDRHGLLRILAGVVIEAHPRQTFFVLDVPSTISETDLAVVTEIVAELREVQQAVATDRQPPCILIACTPKQQSTVLAACAGESVRTIRLESPTVQDIKLAVKLDLTSQHVARVGDRDETAALITAYALNIHTLGLTPPTQSVFETARLITQRVDRCSSPAKISRNGIESAAASVVHDAVAPPWIPVLNAILPRYQNHVAYISTYDTDKKWDINTVWFDIPASLLISAADTRPPGFLVRHPTIPTKVAITAPEALVQWLAAIISQPRPSTPTPTLNQTPSIKIKTNNPYASCTPNTIAYLAALHTTHRKKPYAFNLSHNNVYSDYLQTCAKLNITPKPRRKMYRIGKRLSTQGFIATTRMPHARGRPSMAATMLSPHQLAQLHATIHSLTHTLISPSDTEIATLNESLAQICKHHAPTQHRILNAIIALILKTKKRVLNTADIYATYAATVTSPISRSAFYATLARILKIAHAPIAAIASATIAVDYTPPITNLPDPPPPP